MRQSRQVHDVIRRVRDQGVTVVLVSHNIADVMSLTDRINHAAGARGDVHAPHEREEVVAAMTGRHDAERAA